LVTITPFFPFFFVRPDTDLAPRAWCLFKRQRLAAVSPFSSPVAVSFPCLPFLGGTFPSPMVSSFTLDGFPWRRFFLIGMSQKLFFPFPCLFFPLCSLAFEETVHTPKLLEPPAPAASRRTPPRVHLPQRVPRQIIYKLYGSSPRSTITFCLAPLRSRVLPVFLSPLCVLLSFFLLERPAGSGRSGL